MTAELRRLCNGCMAWKDLTEFPSSCDKKRPNKRSSKCRACKNLITAAWRARHPEYHREYSARREKRTRET